MHRRSSRDTLSLLPPLLALLMYCLPAQAASLEALQARAGDGEQVVAIEVGATSIHALWSENHGATTRGAVLLLSDGSGQLDALRRYLPAHGWHTLLVHLSGEPEADDGAVEGTAPPGPEAVIIATQAWLRKQGEPVSAVIAEGQAANGISLWLATGARPAALALVDAPGTPPASAWRGLDTPILDIMLGYDDRLRRAQDQRRQRLRSEPGYRALTLPPATAAGRGEAMARRVRGWLQDLPEAKT